MDANWEIRRPRRLATGFLGLVLVASACRDEVTPLSSPAPPRASQAADPDVRDSSDFFAADVKVTSAGRHAGAALPAQRREFNYHVERALVGSSWKTTMTIPPNGLGPARAAKHDIARVDIDEDARSVRMFNRDGDELALPDADDPTVGRMARSYGVDTTFARIRPTHGKGERLARNPGRRAWLDGIVVPASDEQRGRRVGQLEQHFGKAKGKVKGLDRYVKDNGGHVVEVLVDPVAGTVAEANVADQGQLKQHTRYGYTELPNHRGYVRQSTHIEVAPKEGATEPTVIDYTLSNIRLERRGGTP
jgi:hypothetical protein